MKTLNLNKLTILLGLFLVSAFFTTSANAACVVDSDGDIVTDYSVWAPVEDTLDDNEDSCQITPAEYKLVFYKYGICKEDPSLNDLSSCAFLFTFDDGMEHDIELGVVETLDIPDFAIEPGIYPYSYVLLSNKLGMKWSGTIDETTEGQTATGTSSSGTTCWTTGRGPTSGGSYQDATGGDGSGALVETVHGNTVAAGKVTIACGTAANSAPLFNYEILTRFSSEDANDDPYYCSDALLASGDLQTFSVEGTGQGRGIPTVSLLTTADAFATTCQNSAKIAWTTALSTSLTITEDSTFAMSMKATDGNTIQWVNTVSNDIQQIQSGAPRIMLTVTD
tara:strand:+ start:108 stop:1115 length:1008 start_codon:yes stop_codon:yes gene_type:complete